MQELCKEQKKRDITEALELFDRLPEDMKDMILAYMREALNENGGE